MGHEFEYNIQRKIEDERIFVPLHKKIPPRRHLHSEECHTTKPGSRFRILKIDLTISKYRCRHNTKASDTFKIEKEDNFFHSNSSFCCLTSRNYEDKIE